MTTQFNQDFKKSRQGLMGVYLLLLFIAMGSSSFAQTPLPYFCGFEDATENATWTLNAGPNGLMAHNKWAIDTAISKLGAKALYISEDAGATSSYTSLNIHVVCYKTFDFAVGVYNLSFDYLVGGTAANLMHVSFVPNSQTTNSSSTSLPTWITASKLTNSVTAETEIFNHSSWSRFETTLNVTTAGQYKLAFIWTNNSSTPILPAPAIDNVQIDNPDCPNVTDIEAYFLGTDLIVKWNGTGTSYDVEYHNQNSGVDGSTNGILIDSLIIPFAEEGSYDFYVRSHCNPSDSSSFAQLNDVFVYDVEAHCIDYLDFNAAGVYCGHSTSTSNNDDPFETAGAVDFGPDSRESRHTVMVKNGETDPITEGLLTTKPVGALASVRLGDVPTSAHSYDAGDESQGIRYTLNITPDRSLIILRYAMVMESGGHSPSEQPRFLLEIKDSVGNLLDATCTRADFRAPNSASDMVAGDGWHVCTDANDVFWRDWTTVGLNMQAYVGQNVRIELSTYDCIYSIHFGYAYFTLDCANATVEGLGCGEFTASEIEAPDGFNYEWTKKGDPTTIISTDKILHVAKTDTNTYYCKVIFTENTACYFNLTVSMKPREPIADFTPIFHTKNCKYTIEFANQSRVETDDGSLGDEDLDGYYWDFGDGRTSVEKNPILSFPSSGGIYNVKLATSMNKGLCRDTLEYNLIVPAIGPKDTTIIHNMCSSDVFEWQGSKYTGADAGKHTKTFRTYAGCDSVVTLDLHIMDLESFEVNDTICYGDTFTFDSIAYTKTTHKNITYVSSYGCDSLVTFNLLVRPRIMFNLAKIDCETGPTTGSITISGAPTGYTYEIDGVEGGRLDSLGPGDYQIVVISAEGCRSSPKTVTIERICLAISVPSDTIFVCADDPNYFISYSKTAGVLDSITLNYDAAALTAGFTNVAKVKDVAGSLEIPMSSVVKPGVYKAKLSFIDPICGNQEKSIPISVYYSSGIMEQKWNNVIALLNPKYNGGYAFSSYQWYKDGEKLPGETNSYLYLGKNETLDTLSNYYVNVTRESDMVTTFSCRLTPTVHVDKTSTMTQPSVSPVSGMVSLPPSTYDAMCYVYSTTGQIIAVTTVSAGSAPEFRAPSQIGIYILNVVYTNGEQQAYKLVVN